MNFATLIRSNNIADFDGEDGNELVDDFLYLPPDISEDSSDDDNLEEMMNKMYLRLSPDIVVARGLLEKTKVIRRDSIIKPVIPDIDETETYVPPCIRIKSIDGSDILQSKKDLKEYENCSLIDTLVEKSLLMFCRKMPMFNSYGHLTTEDEEIKTIQTLQSHLMDGTIPLVTFRYYYKSVINNKIKEYEQNNKLKGIGESIQGMKLLEKYLDNLEVIDPKDDFVEITKSDFVEDITYINDNYESYLVYILKECLDELMGNNNGIINRYYDCSQLRNIQQYLSENLDLFGKVNELFRIHMQSKIDLYNEDPLKYLGIRGGIPSMEKFCKYLDISLGKIKKMEASKVEFAACMDLIKLRYNDVTTRNCENKSPKLLV